ncbi:MAG: putative glycoside hydrolase, partial [Candidatus Staskawiczbacteria bacterium]
MIYLTINMLSKKEYILIVLLVIVIIFAGVSFFIQDENYFNINKIIISNSVVTSEPKTPIYIPPKKLDNPPKIVKAVYVTGYSAGSKKYLEYLSDIFKNTEINSVIVDVKDSSGYVSYNSGVADVGKYNIYRGAVKDIDALINFFHEKNIYVIGRIAVFEDPMY